MDANRRAFQLYLLGSMRNTELVNRALSQLRASRADIESAREWMVAAGFEQPGVRLEDYERLLGQGTRRQALDDAEPYAREQRVFQLDVWPRLNLVVLGSTEGIASGLRFERSGAQPGEAVRLHDLRPWSHVRGDLVNLPLRMRARDEWYPLTDVEAEEVTTSARALLRFDFDLLQAVQPLDHE